jgi:hypothetical protein
MYVRVWVQLCKMSVGSSERWQYFLDPGYSQSCNARRMMAYEQNAKMLDCPAQSVSCNYDMLRADHSGLAAWGWTVFAVWNSGVVEL